MDYGTFWVFLAVVAAVGFGVWWVWIRKPEVTTNTGTGDGSANTGSDGVDTKVGHHRK